MNHSFLLLNFALCTKIFAAADADTTVAIAAIRFIWSITKVAKIQSSKDWQFWRLWRSHLVSPLRLLDIIQKLVQKLSANRVCLSEEHQWLCSERSWHRGWYRGWPQKQFIELWRESVHSQAFLFLPISMATTFAFTSTFIASLLSSCCWSSMVVICGVANIVF